MWHGLACFGQWQGCSSKGIQGCSFAYYPADSGRAPLSNRHAAFLLTVLSVFFFSLLSCFVIGRLRPDWHCSRCAFDEACPWISRGAARSRFVFLLIIDGYPFFIGLHVLHVACVCIFLTELPSNSKSKQLLRAFHAFHALPLQGDLGRSQARTGQGGGRGGESRGLFREILLLSCPKNQNKHFDILIQ